MRQWLDMRHGFWTIIVATICIFAGFAEKRDLQKSLGSISDYSFNDPESSPGAGQRIGERHQHDSLGIPASIKREYSIIEESWWRVLDGASSEDRIGNLYAFEMSDPPGALGLLTFWRDQTVNLDRSIRSLELGVPNFLKESNLGLWKGDYFLVFEGSRDVPQDLLLDLGRRIVTAIDQDNVPPVTVINLPKDLPEPARYSFYQGPAALTSDTSLPPKVVEAIGFHEGVEVTRALYSGGEELLILGYPTPSLARDAMERLNDRIEPSQMIVKQSGVLVAASSVLDDLALNLLESVEYRPTIQWVKDKIPPTPAEEARTLFQLFLGWVVFTGQFMVATIGAGLLVVGCRIWLRRTFPRIAEHDTMIRLGVIDR